MIDAAETPVYRSYQQAYDAILWLLAMKGDAETQYLAETLRSTSPTLRIVSMAKSSSVVGPHNRAALKAAVTRLENTSAYERSLMAFENSADINELYDEYFQEAAVNRLKGLFRSVARGDQSFSAYETALRDELERIIALADAGDFANAFPKIYERAREDKLAGHMNVDYSLLELPHKALKEFYEHLDKKLLELGVESMLHGAITH